MICQFAIINSYAQSAGDIISGTVTDSYGAVIGANVVELDGANRIVASAVTDINGNFSFKLKNPKDKIRFSYVGYKTITQSINKTKFNVTMSDENQIDEVVVTLHQESIYLNLIFRFGDYINLGWKLPLEYYINSGLCFSFHLQNPAFLV